MFTLRLSEFDLTTGVADERIATWKFGTFIRISSHFLDLESGRRLFIGIWLKASFLKAH